MICPLRMSAQGLPRIRCLAADERAQSAEQLMKCEGGSDKQRVPRFSLLHGSLQDTPRDENDQIERRRLPGQALVRESDQCRVARARLRRLH